MLDLPVPGARARAYHFGNQWGLLVIFGLFWFSDAFSMAFWRAVFLVTHLLGVPVELAYDGLQSFRIL